METTQTRLTFEDFESFARLPENRERRLELVNGEVVEKMPTQLHGIICSTISAFLVMYSRQNRVGRVGVEVRHKLPDDPTNAVIPDVAFYLDMQEPVVEQGAVPYLPAVVVEVKSPDDTYKELREKAAYYLSNGTRLVWLVYPEKRLIEAFTPANSEFFTEQDTLIAEDVLPGFSLLVKEIFEL